MVHGPLHPTDLGEIDAIFMLQQPANEDRGRHRIKRDADALAGEIGRRADRFGVDRYMAVPEHARGKDRQCHERTVAGGEAGDEFGARHLGRIELQRARHPIENLARTVDCEEVEIDPVGLNLLGIERQHAVVEPAGEGEGELGHGGGCPWRGVFGEQRIANGEWRVVSSESIVVALPYSLLAIRHSLLTIRYSRLSLLPPPARASAR